MEERYETHISLTAAETDVLLGRAIAADLPADRWPGRDASIAASPRIAALCARVRDAVRHGPGFVVLKIDVARLGDPHALKVAYWNLFTSLGPPIPQYATGEMVFEVEVAPATPIYSHYSRSNRGGGYHTDGTFLQKTPFYAGLICLRQADHGGDTILIDGRRLCMELSRKDAETLERLKRDFLFDCCGQLPGVEFRPMPIVSWDETGLRVRYLRSYIEEGYAKANVPLDEESLRSLDKLDELLDSEEFQHVHKLAPGEMLIFNNYVMLHGRKPFSDEGGGASKRLLARVYAADGREG